MGPWPSYVEYEVHLTAESRFLVIPGLSADQDLQISWNDDADRWRPLDHVFWLQVPAPAGPAAIDLKRLLSGPEPGKRRIRIQLPGPGELAVGGLPYLLR